jgi:hypothetical protein
MKKVLTCESQIRYHRIETASERARFDRAMTLLAGLFAEALDEIYEMDAAEKLKEIPEGDTTYANNTKPVHPNHENTVTRAVPATTAN